ncbi:MAG TPA: transglutaminase domain-containing protein, partial [bacterium]|nr:transglutaminase domain-containing protein [bacterium]
AAFETDSNGFIRDWWIIGGFDNDNGKGFYDEYGPERELDIKKTYKGKVVNVSWRKIRFNGHKGFIPFDSFVSPSNDSLAYMLANIFSPVDKDVILNISTSDAIKIWVNGTNVFEEENISHFGYDNVSVKVKLFKGENTILLKTCQKNDVWSAGVRITETSGKEATDLVVLHNFPKDLEKKTFKAQVLFPYSEKEPVSEDIKENLYKGLTLYFKGYEKYSMNYIRKAHENAPHNLFVMIQMAKVLNTAGEEGKYIDLLNGAITYSSSELAIFLIMRGRFFARKGQNESAENDYKKALELNPASIEALKSQASLFQSKGWHEDSRRTLQKALEIQPDSTSLLKLLASTLNRLNYKEDTEKAYRKALKLTPGDVSLNEELFQISKEKRAGSSALYFLERIIDLSPYNIRAYFELFEFYRSSKDIENALHQLDIIKNINPDNSNIYIKTGDLFYEQNKTSQALASWEKAHELDPKNSYISERISYLKIEEKDEAEKYVPDDVKIMEIIKNSIDFVPDDGAQTLLVYDHAVCKINSDGSSKWYITEVSRALNDAGRDALINSYLPYDGRKRILKTYSVNSSFEKSEASSVSSFDIRFRQLKKGDFTVIQYIHYKPAPVFLENDFVGQWYVQSPMKHVIYSEWNLIYPQGTKLNIDITGKRTEQVFEKLNDLKVHRFIARNIEPLNYEPNSPPLNNFLETVTVSTSESWDKYVNWERALLKDAFVFAKEIRDKAGKIVEGEKTVIGKINKIFTFVAQDIRYQQEYESTIAGVKPHTAAQTLERGYGDCKDKAILFIQLAKELNIKADYVIIRTRNA